MTSPSRREFLSDVGSGMLIAGLGVGVAADLGVSSAFAAADSDRLDFGDLRPLVGLMQDTAPDKLQPQLISKLQGGDVDLNQLVAAGALANAEAFGGQDYVGFHTAMAFLPALEMSKRLPTERQALPVLKVLYRNSGQVQECGGKKAKKLAPIGLTSLPAEVNVGQRIREVARLGKMDEAEQTFASAKDKTALEMLNILQYSVQDDINVHRFVLAHRAHRLVDLVGAPHAHTLLRQSVRQCVHHEQSRLERKYPASPIRTVLPKLMDQYKLAGRKLGTRDPGDKWVDETCEAMYNSTKEEAAELAAAALAEGIAPEVIGETIALAANQLVLRQGADNWRAHGDAAGVHASDGSNAWRNMARVTEDHLAMSGLIVAAFHAALYKRFSTPAYPSDEHRASIKKTDAKSLLAETEDAIKHNDQGRACAAIQVYGEQGHSPQAVFDLMLRYGVSEDGRLHAEKYFHTVTEEYATTRAAFRWRQLVGLARVTASAYGYDRQDKHGDRAPGYLEACRLLKVEA